MRRNAFARVLVVTVVSWVVWGSAGCRPEPEPPGSGVGDVEGRVDIYEIQRPHDDSADPALGSDVYLRSVVVSAYDDYPEVTMRRESDGQGGEHCVEEVGYTGAMVVQEALGGTHSGVALFNPTLVPAHARAGPGDLVDVRGEYLEFCLSGTNYAATSYCQAPNTNRLTQLGRASVAMVGETAPPAPLDVRLSDLGNPEIVEQFEGVLIRVSGDIQIDPCTEGGDRPECCVGDYDRYGNLATSTLSLVNEFYAVPEGTQCLSAVTGIVSWFGHATEWGDYTISPRGPSDVVIPPQCAAQ